MATSIFDFKMLDIKGHEKNLADYKGKVLLIVNVASKCGYTYQYEGLQALFEKYKDRGFMVLGFPSNNFLWQEPGSNETVAQFCSSTYGVSFDMFSKINVRGWRQDPLYTYLTKKSEQPGRVKWNFQKFLLNRKGEVVANIPTAVKPHEIENQIEALLNEPA